MAPLGAAALGAYAAALGAGLGGIAPQKGDEVPEHEPRNPVGRGIVGRDGVPADGQPLPNLEDPKALLSAPTDRPTPACFAPIAPTWLPRRNFAGTYDDAWITSRAPYLPLDFDARFFHVAPPELIAPGFLQGGEPVELAGFTAGPPVRFQLPECGLDLAFDFDAPACRSRPTGDGVVRARCRALQMLWRAVLAVDKSCSS